MRRRRLHRARGDPPRRSKPRARFEDIDRRFFGIELATVALNYVPVRGGRFSAGRGPIDGAASYSGIRRSGLPRQ